MLLLPDPSEKTITPNEYTIETPYLIDSYTSDVVSASVYVKGLSIRGVNFYKGNFEFFVGNHIQSVKDCKILARKKVDVTDLASIIQSAEK
ncbi:immunoglobulin-like domain-containing protein [Enterococcus faecium]|uniref:immunoglobulin-like domain-containing protein n=1 Tax=Enterococcus faecium TaxID=1352 RepID=UPI0023B3244D|nr:immunoglobulin-like domain-containing protein [Enterococcus faecium]